MLIQYPVWWGHGGWLRVHELQQQLAQQTEKNTNLRLRNERVQGEVQDLQGGTAAVEERARRLDGVRSGLGVGDDPLQRSLR